MTPTEITAVFRTVLGSDDVTEDDDFFEVGGSSFSALTLVAQLNDASGAVLRMRDVIRARTPRGLAYVIGTMRAGLAPDAGR